MFYGRATVLWTLVVVSVLTFPAVGQLVISTRSGTVHFFEGAVYLGDQPLEFIQENSQAYPQASNYARPKAVWRCCSPLVSSSA